MKRNSMTVPAAPRSFEELKLARSTASNGNNNTTNMNTKREASPSAHATSRLSNVAGSPKQSSPSTVFVEHKTESTIQRGSTTQVRSGERHRYDTDDDVAASAPCSTGGYADSSPSSPLAPGSTTAIPPLQTPAAAVANAGDGDGVSHDVRRTNNTHGIDLTKSPTIAAGARAAGANQPFFFSLKLPPPSITHIGAARTGTHQAIASFDNNTSSTSNTNTTCDSPYGAAGPASATAGERRERPAVYGRTGSSTAPQKLEDTTAGSTPRIPGATASDSQQQSVFFPRDVGPLPASQTRARNRLPSGTHIRRRPRSVANRRTSGNTNVPITAGLTDSTENVNFTQGTADYWSPTTNAMDTANLSGAAGRSAFSTTAAPLRATSAATSGRGSGGGGRGTGPRSGATAVPHRRRADPSPAPSRPPRARKGAAVIRATSATPGTPALAVAPASSGPTISSSSPSQPELTRWHTSSSQQNFNENTATAPMASISGTSQQQPTWSIPNSPGAPSPLNCSLDNRYLLMDDKEPATAVSAATSAANNSNAQLSCSGTAAFNARNAAPMQAAATSSGAAKPPSGRPLSGSLAPMHTPRASTTSLRSLEDHTPTRQNYLKLAEHYVQLCSAVGELPNSEWVSGLQATESDTTNQQQQQNANTHSHHNTNPLSGEVSSIERLSCGDFTVTGGLSNVKDLVATQTMSPHDNSLNATMASTAVAPSSHGQQQPQTLTPRGGGVRQRSSRAAAAVTPRARTPVASRAKSPRGGAATTSTAVGGSAAKRSGSVGRITAVNRSSILGSSQSNSGGAVHTPRTRGTGTGNGGATSGRTGVAATTASMTNAPPLAFSSTPHETMTDLYAQRVLRYCAEHLQPYVDSMKHVEQQRQVLDEVLNAFVSLASGVITTNNSTKDAAAAAGSGEALRKPFVPLPVNPARANVNAGSALHSHRGPLSSGKGIPAVSSPVPSSLGTTPRKPSMSRTSVTSSLPNTASAAAVAIMSRRSASAASAKAASLTEGLQCVQGAVVALLSSLADCTKLAHIPLTNLPTPSHDDELASSTSQSFSKSGGFPQLYSSLAPLGPVNLPSLAAATYSSITSNVPGVVPPTDRSQTLTQLISPPPQASIASITATDTPPVMLNYNNKNNNHPPAVPYLPLSSAIDSSRTGEDAKQSPFRFTTNDSTKLQSAFECGSTTGRHNNVSTSTTVCPPPIRFLDFVESQEREIAVQLNSVCKRVRAALGVPRPITEKGATATSAAANTAMTPADGATKAAAVAVATKAAAALTVLGSSVQLEQADMLDNPFFVPNKYLQNLAAAVNNSSITTAHNDDETTETATPKQPSSQQVDANSLRAGAKPSSGSPAKFGKTKTKKSKSTKLSSRRGGITSSLENANAAAVAENVGNLTDRSSTESTPRHRPALNAFTPLFTVRLSAEDTMPADSVATNVNNEFHHRSVSSSSTENATLMIADTSGSGYAETFILHCIQPTATAAPATGLTPRQSIDSDFASGRHLSSPQFTVTDLGASSASITSSTVAASASNASPLNRTTGKNTSGSNKATKRATSANAGKRGSGTGQRSKSSGGSTRAGTGAVATSAGGSNTATMFADPPRTTLVVPWLTSQGGRGGTSGGTSAFPPTSKKPRKKTSCGNSNSVLSISTGGPSTSSPSSTPVVASAPVYHVHGHHSQASAAQQLESQRQLATAWKLWSMLEHRFVSSRIASGTTLPSTPDAVTTVQDSVVLEDEQREKAEETQQFSPRPSSTPQSDATSTSPRVRVSGPAKPATAEQHENSTGNIAASIECAHESVVMTSQTTAPTVKTPMAVAAPADLTVVVAVRQAEESSLQTLPSNDEVHSTGSKTLGSCSDHAAVEPFGSMGSPNQRLDGTIGPSKTTVFVEPVATVSGEDEETIEMEERNDEDSAFSYTTARVAENMASLSNALRVPRRLDMEATPPQTQSDLTPSKTESASKLSSQTTAPNALSTTLSQHAALLSASVLASDDVPVGSGVSSMQITDEELKAARRIVAWWTRVRERRARAARLRATHAAANEEQRKKVLVARVRHFLLRCVCRLRLLRRLRSREEETQRQRAHHLPDVFGAAEIRSNSSGTQRSTISSSKKPVQGNTSPPSAASPTAAVTSREKFLRSKEQRKAIAAGSQTNKESSSADTGGSGGTVSLCVPRLPLASSGISTYAMAEYDSDSSFTVSAMHRLLHAPPSLLYTTCTAALHYPTHPPMAYVDNTSRAKSSEGGLEEERQQSEVPPDQDTRCGPEGYSTSGNKRNDINERHGSPGSDTGANLHKSLWCSKGVCFVPFRALRTHLCGEYEARIPPRILPAAMESAVAAVAARHNTSSLDSTLNSPVTSYRCGSRQQTSATILPIPATIRYDSVVEANELNHLIPVTKTFHRPFEQWGMAYNLTSRVFCAAAIYAWQLIFSHTPFDDAKQRDLPTRDDRQARLERVAERNDIILDCYGVRSEREWMREATKDLSFVSQIYVPNYPSDDPMQEKECRDNYNFVKNFLFQCFPNINKIGDIPDFLVGAGIFFVLKEVFHVGRESPLTRRLQRHVPCILVKNGEDYLSSVTPPSSSLYPGADIVNDSDDDDTLQAVSRPLAAPTSLVTPGPADCRKDSNGLSGLQRAALHRFEQLRQLYHLSYGMLDEEERAACAWSGVPPPSDKNEQQQRQGQPSKPQSPSGTVKSTGLTSKERSRNVSACITTEDKLALTGTCGSTSTNEASDDAAVAVSPMRRCLAHSRAGPVTPLRATPTTTAFSSAFTTPAAMREGPRRGSTTPATANVTAATKKQAAAAASSPPPKHTVPPRESDIQLVHVPHRLLRASAANTQFVREFEEEVSKSVHRIIDSVGSGGNDLSLNSAELLTALAAGTDVHDALDIAYPDHFLVKLSEMLAFELFGLQVSLGSCEDLDSVS